MSALSEVPSLHLPFHQLLQLVTKAELVALLAVLGVTLYSRVFFKVDLMHYICLFHT